MFDVAVWLGAIAVFTVVELATVALVSIWFILGAAAAFIVAFFTDSVIIEVAVFLVVSTVSLYFVRRYAKDKLFPKAVATNADMVVGMRAHVTKAIVAGEKGRVKVNAFDWYATSDKGFDVGAECIVKSISGNTLFVDEV